MVAPVRPSGGQNTYARLAISSICSGSTYWSIVDRDLESPAGMNRCAREHIRCSHFEIVRDVEQRVVQPNEELRETTGRLAAGEIRGHVAEGGDGGKHQPLRLDRPA